MPSLNLLYKDSIEINEDISIRIPKIQEILEHDQDMYYELIYLLTAMPIDLMVPLDDQGIDFTQINDYELFLILWPQISMSETFLIFGDLDLTKFIPVQDENGQLVLLDPENDIVIDRTVHRKITTTLRNLHRLEKNTKKPGNEEAKKYMLERARAKARRRSKTAMNSSLEDLIVAMVNTSEFKYNFETVKDLTIYQFNECVEQIKHKFNYDHLMIGVYTGNVDPGKLSDDDWNWLKHK